MMAPSTASAVIMESKSMEKVSRLPVWKPATRADSSGMVHNTNSSKKGVWRQWS